jgi:hypothetical protein
MDMAAICRRLLDLAIGGLFLRSRHIEQVRGLSGREVMEWFSRKTSIAGIQIPNWVVVLGAIIVILLIYTFMQEAQTPD